MWCETLQAIILAGGKGTRLKPYTTIIPKPLMPIGDYSILEVIIQQLLKHKFDDIVITTGYLSQLIKAYLESKEYLNGKIRFTYEEEPLGTIAPLKLIKNLEDTFLVMNGDILSDIDFGDLIAYHHSKGGIATIATYERTVNIDFGVLRSDERNRIFAFEEKPTYNFHVSMGIYVFQKKILDLIPISTHFGFDNLMNIMIQKDIEVNSYPHSGYWLDIGRPDDYARSIEEFEQNSHKFL